jgi:ribosomal protein S7
LFFYNLLNNRCFIVKNEQEFSTIIPFWQNYSLVNFNNLSFFFLIPNFNNIDKNLNCLSLLSYYNSNFTNYTFFNDSKKLFPTKYNYNSSTAFLSNFFYFKNTSFIRFFINNMIDVPICFKKSVSLRTKNFELPLLKFINFLMRKGKKEKCNRIIFSSFRFFFKNIKLNKVNLMNENCSWLDLYMFTNNIFASYYSYNIFSNIFLFDKNFILSHNNSYYNNKKLPNAAFFLKNYLYLLMSKVSPVFSYFIYSVDKNIRKFSRGKSGKYTFIWKYVAPYKRLHLSMRWIIKDIKFFQSKTLNERLSKTFNNLLVCPEKSFSWKSKVFAHNYVFKNFRKNLMVTLRTNS